jgi:hypothetical protein
MDDEKSMPRDAARRYNPSHVQIKECAAKHDSVVADLVRVLTHGPRRWVRAQQSQRERAVFRKWLAAGALFAEPVAPKTMAGLPSCQLYWGVDSDSHERVEERADPAPGTSNDRWLEGAEGLRFFDFSDRDTYTLRCVTSLLQFSL